MIKIDKNLQLNISAKRYEISSYEKINKNRKIAYNECSMSITLKINQQK